jgi:Flp pilus assembly protein TadD
MAVSLPAILLLLDYFPLGRFRRRNWRRLIAEKIPLFLAAAGVAAIAISTQAEGESLASLENISVLSRLALMGQTGILYLIKTIIPVGLNPIYPTDRFLFSSLPAGWAQLLALFAAGVLAALFSGRSRRWLVLGWGCYLLTWLPVSGIFKTGLSAAADRFSYLPAIGLSIVLSFSLSGLGRRGQRIGLIVGAIVVGSLGVLTFRQSLIWNNNLTLWSTGVKLGSAAAHYNLGNALKAANDLRGAIAHYQKALRVRPEYEEAHYNLAIALADSGAWNDAVVHYREAIRLSPPELKARNNLGNALAVMGRREEAAREYEDILKIDPAHAEAHNNLANLLAARGVYKEAIVHYRRALQTDPDYTDALYNLGVTLALTGQPAEAAESYRRTLEIDPTYEKARANLGLLEKETKEEFKSGSHD